MPDTSEGKYTPIKPGVIARMTQAARYVIRGVTPSDWFGPMQPVQPMAPADVAGRRFDYPTGYNLNYTPRNNEPTSFDDLRALADNCDILRSVIETRKDQIVALDWNVRIKTDPDDDRSDATDDQKKRIDDITEFLHSPDQENNFNQWIRQILEDMFVIDAVAIYKRRNRGNGIYSLEVLDGTTIKPLLDAGGRTPIAPDPAFQQVLHGVPAADYTREELIYFKNNPRSNKVYGFGQVEQIIITVNTLIRRALFQLDYYREGSQPDAFLGLPKEWNNDQIRAFQKDFDAMQVGNSGMRRRLKFMPGEFKYQATKEPHLKDEYDEWLARIVCHVFSIAPTPFIKQNNRATAQSSHEAALQEGLAPLQRAISSIINPILAKEFKSPDLEFAYVDDREQDPAQQQVIISGYVNAGLLSIDEGREMIGVEPIGGAAANNMVITANGYVSIDPEENQPEPLPDDGGKPNPNQPAKPKKKADADKAAYSRLRKAGGKKPVPFRVQRLEKPRNLSKAS